MTTPVLDAYEIDCDGRGENVWEVYRPDGQYVATVTLARLQALESRENVAVTRHTAAVWYAAMDALNG